MAVLRPSEYNASYFDGASQVMQHNAGYSSYKRWYRNDGVGSLGEYWKDYANKFVTTHSLVGKKTLEIGCAKGFLVKDFRDMGVDARGIDVSPYAISECEPSVASFLQVGDARTALASFKNKEFDVVLSFRFLECISDIDLPALISEMSRISKLQIHTVDDFTGTKAGAAQYYTQKTLQQWTDLSFPKFTKLTPQENLDSIVTK